MTIDGAKIIFFLKERTDERIEAAFRKAANRTLLAMADEAGTAWDERVCDPKGLKRPGDRDTLYDQPVGRLLPGKASDHTQHAADPLSGDLL